MVVGERTNASAHRSWFLLSVWRESTVRYVLRFMYEFHQCGRVRLRVRVLREEAEDHANRAYHHLRGGSLQCARAGPDKPSVWERPPSDVELRLERSEPATLGRSVCRPVGISAAAADDDCARDATQLTHAALRCNSSDTHPRD